MCRMSTLSVRSPPTSGRSFNKQAPSTEVQELSWKYSEEALAAERESSVTRTSSVIARQRRKMKLFAKGDSVEVFSARSETWFLDGEVDEVAVESCWRGDTQVTAGSMKVLYDGGRRVKWVAPRSMEAQLRPSPLPRRPSPMTGVLSAESVGWCGITQWEQRFFEVKRGVLQWWADEERSQNAKPDGKISLLGAEVSYDGELLMLQEGRVDGVHSLHSFAAESERQVASWATAIGAHASYCRSLHGFTSEADAAAADSGESFVGRWRTETMTQARQSSSSRTSARASISSSSGSSSVGRGDTESQRRSLSPRSSLSSRTSARTTRIN